MASTRFSHLRPARSALWCATAVAALVVGTPLMPPGATTPVRHGSRGPAAGCSGRGRGTAEHLHLQPRRPPRRLPRSYRPPAVHAQDQSVDGGRPQVLADVRRGPFVLSVPVLADDRPLPAQQRGAQPAGGPLFDGAHSMACYLRTAGYATYLDGKFLTTWPKTTLPPCFDHSTVMWGGYNNVQVKIDGDVEEEHRLLDDRTSARRVGPTSRARSRARSRSSSTRPRKRRTGWT